ncbi:uncharacterized protein si:ch211-243a20.3 [Syngnathoides biaculeatus]|uniref:uncharacterized protein si:ch211-243a20.3 n=1 Tax=Syngnathoides biaculeatus TaxID=300417 RepID=UPI002ADE2236|nr:uncharacterized protein si:ch211-243a20.3 [Syngnathoides biaculeatus]
MNPHSLVVLVAVAAVTGAHPNNEQNEPDHGHWNYREGADRVDVASVRSLTKVLDAWGKGIFKEIKTLLHSQPNALLPDYSRVRPLSETIDDLFTEVSALHRRIKELSRRLATTQPFLRRHGYREERLADDPSPVRQRLTGGEASPARDGSGARARVRGRRRKPLQNQRGGPVHGRG